MVTLDHTAAPEKASGSSWLWENLKTLFYAVLIAATVRTVAYEPFNIPSESMVPNLMVGDYLFVSKLSYGYGTYSAPFAIPTLKDRLFFTPPQRGDVVVFRLPRDPKISYIKRLIGLPGDEIQVINGLLHINGQPVKREALEPYPYKDEAGFPLMSPRYRETLPGGASYITLESAGEQGYLDNTEPFRVPEDHYFMMGDNRDRSADSRDPTVGFVPKANLSGKARLVVLSMGCNAKLWEVWKCPGDFDTSRLFQRIK